MENFFEFSDTIIKLYELKGYQKGRNIRYALLKFKKFISAEIKIDNIDKNLIKQYETYLRVEKAQSDSTIRSDFKILKIIFNKAVEKQIIKYVNNPFYKYKLPAQISKKEHLNQEEIKAIEDIELPKNRIVNKIRDLFLFSYYCGGIRISDLLILKKSDYDKTYINYLALKNNYQHRIKVPIKAKKIIEKYQKIDCPNKFLIPMFKRKIDINNEQELFEKKSSKINQINLGLKTIAFEAGIKKNLSFHCSRHAFATNAITKGVSIKNVSKILGHSNIQMTLHYAKIEASLLDNAMDKFND